MEEYAGPLNSIYLHVTTRCNLKCRHCAVVDTVPILGELHLREIQDLVERAVDLGTTYMVLTGGEPLIREDFPEIASSVLSRGVRLGVATNGTLLRPDKLSWTRDFDRSRFFFGVSLDGAAAETHDRIRNTPGAFDRTINGLSYAHSLGLQLTVQTVLQKTNAEQLRGIAQIAASYGADLSVIPDITAKGAGANRQSQNLSISRILELAERLRRFAAGIGARARVNLPPALLGPENFTKSALACYWGTHFCGILPNGDVAMCHGCDFCDHSGCGSFVAGNVREECLADIWRRSECFQELRAIDPDAFEGVCGRCALRSYCRGHCRLRAFLDFGSLFGPEPLCQAAYEAGVFPSYLLDH